MLGVSGAAASRSLLPSTIVLRIINIAWYFDKFQRQTRLLVERVECKCRLQTGTCWSKSPIVAAKTILATSPFGDGESPSLVEVWRLANVVTVIFLVKKVVGASSGIGCSVNVENSKGLSWVYAASCCTVLIFAKAEFSHVMGGTVFAGGVVVGLAIEPEIQSILHLEKIAFSCQ